MRTTTRNGAPLGAERRAGWRRSLAAAVAATALAVVHGCSAGYDTPIPADYQTPQGDLDCMNNTEPSQGDVCTQDCLTATCAGGMGRRICSCGGGVFLQCACLPPANWPYDDVPTAPYCDSITGEPMYLAGELCKGEGLTCISSGFPEQGCTCVGGFWQCGASAGLPQTGASCESYGNGKGAVLDDQPCDAEWRLCITRDYNDTGTSPRGCACLAQGARLLWKCGSTNRWWRAE